MKTQNIEVKLKITEIKKYQPDFSNLDDEQMESLDSNVQTFLERKEDNNG
jgi:hypothetical protein